MRHDGSRVRIQPGCRTRTAPVVASATASDFAFDLTASMWRSVVNNFMRYKEERELERSYLLSAEELAEFEWVSGQAGGLHAPVDQAIKGADEVDDSDLARDCNAHVVMQYQSAHNLQHFAKAFANKPATDVDQLYAAVNFKALFHTLAVRGCSFKIRPLGCAPAAGTTEVVPTRASSDDLPFLLHFRTLQTSFGNFLTYSTLESCIYGPPHEFVVPSASLIFPDDENAAPQPQQHPFLHSVAVAGWLFHTTVDDSTEIDVDAVRAWLKIRGTANVRIAFCVPDRLYHSFKAQPLSREDFEVAAVPQFVVNVTGG